MKPNRLELEAREEIKQSLLHILQEADEQESLFFEDSDCGLFPEMENSNDQ